MGVRKGTLESLVNPAAGYWKDRSVFLTGHTGFKGGWLALWLHRLGANVHGYALDPPTSPNLFDTVGVASLISSDTRGNLADLPRLTAAIAKAKPEVVFHLAAQPLVRESYRDPVGTFVTNAVGTAHVLEASRVNQSVRTAIVITTDKVYQNRETEQRYPEGDPLGGRDPYSASKASAEIITASYRASFFRGEGTRKLRVASARAGNVIGGADWAADRLVPDCVRAFQRRESVQLRYPLSVRPWQHVLEPLSGYLRLAELLDSPSGNDFAAAWNFGPDDSSDATVRQIADSLAHLWGDGARVEEVPSATNPHEAEILRLDSTRARDCLGWKPRWALKVALVETVAWYRAWSRGEDMARVSIDQIQTYESAGSN